MLLDLLPLFDEEAAPVVEAPARVGGPFTRVPVPAGTLRLSGRAEVWVACYGVARLTAPARAPLSAGAEGRAALRTAGHAELHLTATGEAHLSVHATADLAVTSRHTGRLWHRGTAHTRIGALGVNVDDEDTLLLLLAAFD